MYPDFTLPFTLHTDASGEGLGAALYQVQGGKLHVVAYASRSLSQAERKYSAYRREFLALKWAVAEKFKEYLYGHKCHLITDSNPLTYLLSSAKLSATDHRWLALLLTYDITISYRKGQLNRDADGLSRIPHRDDKEVDADSYAEFIQPLLARVSPLQEGDEVHCTSAALHAISEYHEVDSEFQEDFIMFPAVEAVAMQLGAVTTALIDPPGLTSTTDLGVLSDDDWSQYQGDDPKLRRVIDLLSTTEPAAPKLGEEHLDVRRLMGERERLSFKNGVLHRCRIPKPIRGCYPTHLRCKF